MQFTYKKVSGISEENVLKYKELLSGIIGKLKRVASDGGYDTSESFINLPFDEDLLDVVTEAKNKLSSPRLKYIFVIGIGGSYLGTKSVYDALGGFYESVETRTPRVIFIDTINQNFIPKIKSLLYSVSSPDEIAVFIVSKSGKTLETVVNANLIISELDVIFGDEHVKRVAVISDQNSPLYSFAKEKNMLAIPIPQKIGGRFSVFSAVGLLPLALSCINIESFFKGAQNMRDICLEDLENNPAAISASILFEYNKKGRNIHDTFLFNPELESLGKWYRQLLAESVGKNDNKEGNEVRAGITPTVSIGSNDLHSVAQLYFGGPQDKITTFVRAEEMGDDSQEIIIAKDSSGSELIPNMEGKSAGEISKAIYEGVKSSYEEKGLPFMEIGLSEISSEALGEFLQFKMMEVVYLGDLYDVNAFDQPSVELYKERTRNLLASNPNN